MREPFFLLQKMENQVTLLARVLSKGYGGFAQPANIHVGNKATITTLHLLWGILRESPVRLFLHEEYQSGIRQIFFRNGMS